MSNTTPVPKAVRQLVIVSSALLLASLVISGFNAYATLAAPPQSPYVPTVVGFEGQLANAAGQPVADGNYTITFSLYSQATGGTALWSETKSVAVADGLYSVQLGSVTPLNPTHFEGNRWLGVQVSGDSEMTPRVPISAVPFALNARQSMGLQGYDVASTAPTNGQVLTWDNTNNYWEPDLPGARTFPELAPVGSNEDPQDFFRNYRNGGILRHIDTNTIEVSSGEIIINGYMRRNTSAVNVGFSGTANGPNRGLDTGSAQPNTTYYVYAVADDAENSFDLIISASGTAPTGPTNYRLLGSLQTGNSPSPIQILPGTVRNSFPDAYAPFASGYYVGNGTTNRLIPVGFRPQAVMVFRRNVADNTTTFVARVAGQTWNSLSEMSSCYVNASSSQCYVEMIKEFEASGFRVSTGASGSPHLNNSDSFYYWMAWGY